MNKKAKSNEPLSLEKIRASLNASKSRKEIAKKIFKGIGILLLVAVIIIVFQNRSDLTLAGFENWFSDKSALSGIGKGYPIGITGGSSKSIDTFGDAVIELTDTSFVVLNSSGKEAASRQHGFASPAISSTDRYAMLYDVNGTGYRIESVSKTVYNGTAENKIICAALSKSGRYAIVTKNSSYLATLYVYSKNHELVYSWNSAFYQIESVSVSPNGKHIAVTGITTENGEMKSTVIVFDYKQKSKSDTAVNSRYEFYDTMLVGCEFTSSDRITAIGDSAAYIIKVGKEESTEISYNGRLLAGYDTDYNYGTVLLLSDFYDLHNCSVVFADEKGKILSDTETSLDGGFVLLKGKNMFTVSGNTLYEYHSDGKLKNQLEVGSNIKQCAVLGNNVYTLDSSTVNKIAL